MVGNKIKSGFTIVELLVVIVVIGILSTLVIGGGVGYFRKAADTATRVSLEVASSKLDTYKLKNGAYESAGLTGYTPEPNVTVTTVSMTYTEYCLKAVHTKYSDIIYYVKQKRSVTTASC